MDKHKKAVLLIILSTASFSLMSIMVKVSSSYFSIMQQVFSRNIIILLVALIFLMTKKINPFGKKKNRLKLLARGVSGYIGVSSFFYAINNMIVADAAILQNTSPFFVTLFSAIFLKEKLTKTHIFVLFLALTGAMFVIKPQFNVSIIPALIGLSAGMCAGVSFVIISCLKGEEDSFVIIFYFSLLSCIASLILGFNTFVMPDLRGGIILILIGIFAGTGQYLVTVAYSLSYAGAISVYNYIGIILSSILGFLILHEVMDIFSLIGILIIITSAIIIYLRQKRQKLSSTF